VNLRNIRSSVLKLIGDSEKRGRFYFLLTAPRRKFRYDLHYVSKQSFWLDLRLIAISFWISSRGKPQWNSLFLFKAFIDACCCLPATCPQCFATQGRRVALAQARPRQIGTGPDSGTIGMLDAACGIQGHGRRGHT